MTEPSFEAIGAEETFSFECGPDRSCFNQCCRDLCQMLTPYDILRMKNHLAISSTRFLAQYTTESTGPESGLPIISLKPLPGDDAICPFVTPDGCAVYENRPSSCRIYPLARALSRHRQTGQLSEHFALLREPHCKGFAATRAWTASQWMDNQGLTPYNQANDRMMELISMKNQMRPGPLDLKSKLTFYTGLYDLDAFHRQLFDQGTIRLHASATELDRARENDDHLLQLGMRWVQANLFGPGEET